MTTPPLTQAESNTAVLAEKPIQSGMDCSIDTRVSPQPKDKTFWQLLNLSIGFLGIQFAWAIQMGQMSPLLESLGSVAWLTSLIWCAGPVTGIVVQPIVGSWSDRTWTFMGRRRPFLLAGAILTALSLIAMPNSPSLLVAALLLWVLDASINVSQGPYRALVPDVVPQKQQAFTYALMSFTIGLGSVAAFYIGSDIPKMRTWAAEFISQFQVPQLATPLWNWVIAPFQGLAAAFNSIPDMHFLFYLGAVSMLVAMGWTIFSTPEVKREPVTGGETTSPGLFAFFRQTWNSIAEMPQEIKKLCLMHSFTWFGLQCLFIFFTLYVAHNLYGTHDTGSDAYKAAIAKASYCYFLLNLVCFVVSPFIGKLCEIFSKKAVHTVGLLCLGGGLLSSLFLASPDQAMIAMAVIGVGWATTLSVPFAILASKVPVGKEGVLMGTFNIFIAAPQFVASTLAGFLVTFTQNDTTALVLGGLSVLISAFLLQWVKE